MPFVGITPPAGGLPPERRVERDRRVRRVERTGVVEREVDEADLSSVEKVHADEAAQPVATEESLEDRQSHGTAPTYQPDAQPHVDRPPRIDLKG